MAMLPLMAKAMPNASPGNAILSSALPGPASKQTACLQEGGPATTLPPLVQSNVLLLLFSSL